MGRAGVSSDESLAITEPPGADDSGETAEGGGELVRRSAKGPKSESWGQWLGYDFVKGDLPMPDLVHNLYEAKISLSQLVDRASSGEEIFIAKAGKPMAKLVPIPQSRKPRKPGG
jgi:prevent-host-death family protein